MRKVLSKVDWENIQSRFNDWIRESRNGIFAQRNADVVADGILDTGLYAGVGVRILWVLKQDYYDSGALEIPYAQRLKDAIQSGALSPSWCRMAQVSYGVIHSVYDFEHLPDVCECAKDLLKTAVIEVDKELGESRSPDGVILDGFEYYWEKISRRQIIEYDPDLIIVGMTGKNECLRVVPERIFHIYRPNDEYVTSGHLCESAELNGKRLLWTCHPQVTSYGGVGISDRAFFESVLQALEY